MGASDSKLVFKKAFSDSRRSVTSQLTTHTDLCECPLSADDEGNRTHNLG